MAASTGTRYSTETKVDVVLAMAKTDGNALLAARLYGARYPHRPLPSRSTFITTFRRFCTTGSVHRQRQKSDTVINEDFEIDVLACVTSMPEISIRQIANESGRSFGTVARVLKKHGLHPYHVCLHQDLSEADFERRLDFCNWGLIKIEEESDFLQRVMWTDEARFCRNGTVNVHNAHYWSQQNPHWLRQHKHQVRWSVNVWCGILGDRIIGPYFFEGNLDSKKYTQEILSIVVDNFACDLSLNDLRKVWFQHDGAPPHFSTSAKRWLDRHFSGQWIGRGGAMFWPPRSPDLSPLDFFLWGYVKDQVFATEPIDINDMKNRITSACASIRPEVLRRVTQSVRERFMFCIAVEGKHFEHYLKH